MQEIENPVVAALPGTGWRAEYNDDGGDPWSEPVIAFIVHANGLVQAVSVAADGEMGVAQDSLEFRRIYGNLDVR